MNDDPAMTIENIDDAGACWTVIARGNVEVQINRNIPRIHLPTDCGEGAIEPDDLADLIACLQRATMLIGIE